MSTTQIQLCLMVAVAVEISGAKWLVGSTAGGKFRTKALMQKDATERYAALVAEIVEAVKRLGGVEGTRVVVAYEAGHEGFWLVRALRSAGFEAEVIDPASLQVDRRARRAKTDRLDVRALTWSLYRWMRGEEQALRMVQVIGEADEDAREWQRERDRLESARRGGLDRIGKKMRTHGIWTWQRQALRDGSLRRFDGEPLGPVLQKAMLLELDRVEAIEAALAELQKQEVSPEAQEKIDALSKLRGIGPVGATGLALLLYWRDFNNRRQVGSCTGLVNSPYSSGTIHQDQGISKQSDPRLRALLVELSWLWLRYQPDSDIAQWFFNRTQGQGKRHRRIMIVAVARRLAIALWRYLSDGVIPPGAVLSKARVR
jgi:transposase